jgi:hypothetical protein
VLGFATQVADLRVGVSVMAAGTVFPVVMLLFRWVDENQDRKRREVVAKWIWGIAAADKPPREVAAVTTGGGLSFQDNVAEFFDVVYASHAKSTKFLWRFLAIDTALFLVFAALIYVADFTALFGKSYAEHGHGFMQILWDAFLNLFGAANVVPEQGAYIRWLWALTLLNWYPMFLVVDFIALSKTRAILKYMKGHSKVFLLTVALALDMIGNALIAYLVVSGLEFSKWDGFIDPGHFMDLLLGPDRYHSEHGMLGEFFLWDASGLAAVLLLPFVNSVWLWIFVLSSYLTRALTTLAKRLVSLNQLLTVRAHPMRYIGIVAASIVATVAFIIA